MFEYENLIEVKFENFKAIHYVDYFYNEKFFNVEIYKGRKCLMHATLEKPMDEIELKYYLKAFVKNTNF